jgi:hypothetical protein
MHVRERYPQVSFEDWERAYLAKLCGATDADLRRAANGDLPSARLHELVNEWQRRLASDEGKGFKAGFAAGVDHPKPQMHRME